MEIFQILIAESHISKNGEPFTKEDGLTFHIPEEVQNLLDPIMKPYGNSPFFYFDRITFNNQNAPWALVCLDREYQLAGHIVTKRPPNGGINFTQYQSVPDPIPSNFVPNVGTLVFGDKDELELVACQSLIFQEAWNALKNCSQQGSWLVILDPLPEKWLTEHLPGDSELYLSTKK